MKAIKLVVFPVFCKNSCVKFLENFYPGPPIHTFISVFGSQTVFFLFGVFPISLSSPNCSIMRGSILSLINYQCLMSTTYTDTSFLPCNNNHKLTRTSKIMIVNSRISVTLKWVKFNWKFNGHWTRTYLFLWVLC